MTASKVFGMEPAIALDIISAVTTCINDVYACRWPLGVTKVQLVIMPLAANMLVAVWILDCYWTVQGLDIDCLGDIICNNLNNLYEFV